MGKTTNGWPVVVGYYFYIPLRKRENRTVVPEIGDENGVSNGMEALVNLLSRGGGNDEFCFS